MEPFSMMAMMGTGLLMQYIGNQGQQAAAAQYNQAQVGQINTEEAINNQRRQWMEVDARRKSMENLRNVQNARAFALTNATSQGAQFGSGLQGGFSQVSAEGAWNELNIKQGLNIGRNVFNLDDKINQYRIQMANAQLSSQSSAGLSSMGQSLFSAAGSFGRLASGFGGNPNANGGGVNNASGPANYATLNAPGYGSG